MKKNHSFKKCTHSIFPFFQFELQNILNDILIIGEFFFEKFMLANGADLAIGLEVVPQYFPY